MMGKATGNQTLADMKLFLYSAVSQWAGSCSWTNALKGLYRYAEYAAYLSNHALYSETLQLKTSLELELDLWRFLFLPLSVVANLVLDNTIIERALNC